MARARALLKTKGEDNPGRTKTDEELALLKGTVEEINSRLAYLESLANKSSHSRDKKYDNFTIRVSEDLGKYYVFGAKGEYLEGLSNIMWLSIEKAKSAGQRYMQTGSV